MDQEGTCLFRWIYFFQVASYYWASSLKEEVLMQGKAGMSPVSIPAVRPCWLLEDRILGSISHVCFHSSACIWNCHDCDGLDLRLKGKSVKGTLKKILKWKLDPSHARKEEEQINNLGIKQFLTLVSWRCTFIFAWGIWHKEMQVPVASKSFLFQSSPTSDRNAVSAVVLLGDLRWRLCWYPSKQRTKLSKEKIEGGKNQSGMEDSQP